MVLEEITALFQKVGAPPGREQNMAPAVPSGGDPSEDPEPEMKSPGNLLPTGDLTQGLKTQVLGMREGQGDMVSSHLRGRKGVGGKWLTAVPPYVESACAAVQ